MRCIVTLPTYEEAGNIERVLRRVRASVPDADVLVVDDNSSDGTAEVANAVARDLGQIDVLVRPRKAGLGSAYRAAFRLALDQQYDVVVEMDADLSHDPAALPHLLAAVEGGADLAIGSRYVPGGGTPDWSVHRRLLSRWGNRYAAALLRLSIGDATSGFRAYRADLLRRIDFDGGRADGYGFQVELAYSAVRVGARVIEVPIIFTDRMRGKSKMSSGIIVEALALVTWWGLRDRALGRLRPTTGRPTTPPDDGYGAPPTTVSA